MQQSDSDTQPACSCFGVSSIAGGTQSGTPAPCKETFWGHQQISEKGKTTTMYNNYIMLYELYNGWGWMIPIMRGAAGQWFLENLRSHTVHPPSRLGTIQNQINFQVFCAPLWYHLKFSRCLDLFLDWMFLDTLSCLGVVVDSWTYSKSLEIFVADVLTCIDLWKTSFEKYKLAKPLQSGKLQSTPSIDWLPFCAYH